MSWVFMPRPQPESGAQAADLSPGSGLGAALIGDAAQLGCCMTGWPVGELLGLSCCRGGTVSTSHGGVPEAVVGKYVCPGPLWGRGGGLMVEGANRELKKWQGRWGQRRPCPRRGVARPALGHAVKATYESRKQ